MDRIETVDRLPLGVYVDLGDRAPLLEAITPDPTGDSPHRLRLDFVGEEPDWRLPGEILHFTRPPTATQLAAWEDEFRNAA